MELKPAKVDFSHLWVLEEKTVTSKYRGQYEICKILIADWNLPLYSKVIYEDKQQLIVEVGDKP